MQAKAQDSGVMLRIEGITKRFGGLTALDNVSLEVQRGTLHAIIGPNGSGKTTLFNVLSGLLPADGGRVVFNGRDITGLPPYLRARQGLRRTFQQVRLFGSLTVRQNILASYLESKRAPLAGRITSQSQLQRGYVDDIIEFFRLEPYADSTCSALPYGVQKITEMARAMVTQPDILLLDEPVNGMNAEEVALVSELFRDLRSAFAVTILLIEHNMALVMNEAEIVTVLARGLNLAEGIPSEVSQDDRVIEAYLGKEDLPDVS